MLLLEENYRIVWLTIFCLCLFHEIVKFTFPLLCMYSKNYGKKVVQKCFIEATKWLTYTKCTQMVNIQ